MIIIGEKINGAIPKTREAIDTRNAAYIQELVRKQEEAGAHYIDICAGTAPEVECETLCWLLDVVQEVSTKPLAIDSPDPQIILQVFDRVKIPGMINSISLEGNKCEVLLPLLKEHPEWKVVALACDQNGIAEKAEDKAALAFRLIEKAAEHDVTPDRIYIDPLVLALSAVNSSAIEFTKAIRMIKEKYPTVNITAALSNISFGMPARRIINTNFLTLAMEAGLDSMIADPTSKAVTETIYGTNALLGRDRLCRNYNKAYRKGIIGTQK